MSSLGLHLDFVFYGKQGVASHKNLHIRRRETSPTERTMSGQKTIDLLVTLLCAVNASKP